MIPYDMDFFEKNLKLNNLKLDEHQMNQFVRFYELLIETNKVMNLTAITEYEDVVLKHFIDSLSIVRAVDLKQVHSVIDVGTGAGFPGIPLKIAFPHLQITLMDSLNKRIKFLQTVIEELKLKNIETVHARAEDLARKSEYREHYDLVVSRAVANLNTLSEYCVPFAELNGCFVSYKAGDCEEEVNHAKHAVGVIGGSISKKVSFLLPETDFQRTLVVIKKTRMTPKRFPRKAGMPSSEPLQ